MTRHAATRPTPRRRPLAPEAVAATPDPGGRLPRDFISPLCRLSRPDGTVTRSLAGMTRSRPIAHATSTDVDPVTGLALLSQGDLHPKASARAQARPDCRAEGLQVMFRKAQCGNSLHVGELPSIDTVLPFSIAIDAPTGRRQSLESPGASRHHVGLNRRQPSA